MSEHKLVHVLGILYLHEPIIRTCSRTRQRGQALVEGLVAMLALIAMAGSIAWLYRLQDIALQASHASRALAFEYARNPQAQEVSAVAEHVFHRDQRWNDKQGNSLLRPGSVQRQVLLSNVPMHLSQLPEHAVPRAATAWQELSQAGGSIATALVVVSPDGGSARLKDLKFMRQIAILFDAGHAESHEQTQQRIAQSASLWRSTADVSSALGRKTQMLLKPVDAAWNRPSPDFDWLSSWAGGLPSYLQKP